jgi:hypothetical protein
MTRLRLVTPSRSVFAHTNRMGVTYYLHEGRTKTGKPHYFFARTAGQETLGEMLGAARPDGRRGAQRARPWEHVPVPGPRGDHAGRSDFGDAVSFIVA